MNKRMMKFTALAGVLSVAFFLSACGDEITEVTNTGMSSVTAYKDLAKCGDKNEGELVFVKDSGAVYLCSGKEWNDINGSDGKNGVGCTSKSVEGGVKITCGDSEPVIIKNGISADDDACKITSDKDGVVTFECGDKTTKLYKAICDTTPYDPEIQFCYEKKLYDLYGDDDDPTSEPTYDCSVSDGVKVVYPTKGETFKIGQKVTVVYGSAVDGSGYRFVFKKNEDDAGKDLTKGSVGLAGKGDGKTCYEVEVVLDAKIVTETKTGIIRVVPYERSNKGANSAEFTVKK